jgi:hypothetical protein
MPEVVLYLDLLTVYESNLNIILNTAPNLTGIDQEVEVTQDSGAITIIE